ncbi:MAG: TauD/TfdA family dioxygenase [Pseudomonadota bacterium]
MSKKFEISELAPFGAEISGLNLWETLDAETVAHLASLWSRHGLLLFRRQALSESELVDFSAAFGKADIIVREDWQSESRPEVIRISNMKDYFGNSIGGLGAGELDWHTDQSYMVDPATGSVLYMVEMPSPAPATYWANMRLAHDALPEDLAARADDIDVVYDYLVRQSKYDNEPKLTAELRRKTPLVTHPLVNVHPVSGERALYLDPTTAAGIEGWDEASAAAHLKAIAAHATQPQFVYRHDWQIGDVVMWDNGFLMHRRDEFDATGNRLLKRTTLRLPPDRHIVPSGRLAA